MVDARGLDRPCDCVDIISRLLDDFHRRSSVPPSVRQLGLSLISGLLGLAGLYSLPATAANLTRHRRH